ncbi:MAG: hypothetical protein IKV91_00350 [Bacteroidales bacterium]|nr:hypothetical protein [Bacteroidales bacterium]
MCTFDPMRVNAYTIEELADMVEQGVVTKDEIYSCGLAAPKRPQLEAELIRRQQVIIDDDEMWAEARRRNTIPAYNAYLGSYDKYPPQYRGKHVTEAKMSIQELQERIAGIRNRLFDMMRNKPGVFKHSSMEFLFNGVPNYNEWMEEAMRKGGEDESVISFVKYGLTISYQDLLDNDVIPDSISKDSLVASDYTLTQTNMEQLHYFPTERRTDVYFIGVPRSGKSSVMAALCSAMHTKGCVEYQPHYNNDDKDNVRGYYNSLIRSTRKGKYPVSTQKDSLCFIKLLLKSDKRESPLTFVELGGEAFRTAVQSGMKGKAAWQGLSAGTCLDSKNPKLMFFIIDYSTIFDHDKRLEQDEILNTMLTVLTTDGPSGDGTKGCTMSKVKTVAIIVTKSDLMNAHDYDEQVDQAEEFINEHFAAFKKTLSSICKKYGINRQVNYKLYVTPFSTGRMYIGNTYKFDPADADALVDFISDSIEGTDTSVLGHIFGKA